ncbi:UNVERIFIED_CONTAM: hypothetical protein FKN15_038328 [Acipenser sinensis]
MELSQEEEDGSWELFLKGLAAELCPGCGAYGHTVAICPTQYEEEELEEEEPVCPVSGGEEPVCPVSGGEEPVCPVSGGEEPVRPVSGGEEPVRPVPGGEEPVCPVSRGEEPVRPVSGGEEPVRPVSGGEEPVRPVSGGEKLKAKTPILIWEGRGREAQAPQQPLFLLLKGAQRRGLPPVVASRGSAAAAVASRGSAAAAVTSRGSAAATIAKTKENYRGKQRCTPTGFSILPIQLVQRLGDEAENADMAAIYMIALVCAALTNLEKGIVYKDDQDSQQKTQDKLHQLRTQAQ